MLDWDKVPKPLRIRNWRPGDCYQPQGRTGAKKIKSLFQESKVAKWQRGRWPVIIGTAGDKALKGASDQIVWVRDFGAAAAYAADEDSRVVLEVAEIERA